MAEFIPTIEDVPQTMHFPLLGKANAIGIDLVDEDEKQKMKFPSICYDCLEIIGKVDVRVVVTLLQ